MQTKGITTANDVDDNGSVAATTTATVVAPVATTTTTVKKMRWHNEAEEKKLNTIKIHTQRSKQIVQM